MFGGAGFLGRRVVQHLSESGATVRAASRRPRQVQSDNVEQIAADARDERSVEAAFAGADGVVNAISLMSSTAAIHSIRCTWKRPPRSRA
jgi:uncharacterized protein YbjT (DUF2867 family)